MKKHAPGQPDGQVLTEVILWIPLLMGLFLVGSSLFKREYKQYKIDFESQRYHLNGGKESGRSF